jgi:endonuclease/exonuclease/phosphatase family metal-dependent hydrolase
VRYALRKSPAPAAFAQPISDDLPILHRVRFSEWIKLRAVSRLNKRFAISFLCCACVLASCTHNAATVRVTTWNLNWFPNTGPKESSAQKQQERITEAAKVLRSLNPDIILLQEVRDYDACTRLAEAIEPHHYQVAVCSAFKQGIAIAKQQVAILAKEPAQAAWSEQWKSMEGVDPPRGFAFRWFKIAVVDVGVYSLHLKSNLIMRGDKAAEAAKNTRKRELAAQQLLKHVRDVVTIAMPNVRSVIVGGDFNTNSDEFTADQTLKTLTDAGFTNCMEKLPLARRLTHRGSGGHPDATFDYLFVRNAALRRIQITRSTVSDHLPVTCDVKVSLTATTSTAQP